MRACPLLNPPPQAGEEGEKGARRTAEGLRRPRKLVCNADSSRMRLSALRLPSFKGGACLAWLAAKLGCEGASRERTDLLCGRQRTSHHGQAKLSGPVDARTVADRPVPQAPRIDQTRPMRFVRIV